MQNLDPVPGPFSPQRVLRRTSARRLAQVKEENLHAVKEDTQSQQSSLNYQNSADAEEVPAEEVAEPVPEFENCSYGQLQGHVVGVSSEVDDLIGQASDDPLAYQALALTVRAGTVTVLT